MMGRFDGRGEIPQAIQDRLEQNGKDSSERICRPLRNYSATWPLPRYERVAAAGRSERLVPGNKSAPITNGGSDPPVGEMLAFCRTVPHNAFFQYGG
jgi:hypothetical protein